MSNCLNANAKTYMESWIAIEADIDTVNIALRTIQRIYTHVKALETSIAHYTDKFRAAKRHDLIIQDRFDVIESNIKKGAEN
jgi:hypothetical protein